VGCASVETAEAWPDLGNASIAFERLQAADPTATQKPEGRMLGLDRIPGWTPQSRTIHPDSRTFTFDIPGIDVHHYATVTVCRYGLGQYNTWGMYVFQDAQRDRFFLWSDCGMSHLDQVLGPFRGDPRRELRSALR
jgi:hypothetical protein